MAETKPLIPPRFGAREAQPLSGFLEQTRQVDLDKIMGDLVGSPELAQELKREREQIVAQAREIAEKYPAFVEWICDISLRKPMHILGLGQASNEYIVHRDGMNKLAWQIVQAIAEGRDQPPPMREGV